LRRTIIAAGLLDRAYRYYLVRTLICVALLGFGPAIAFVLPPAVGWSTLAAIILGFASVQLGLLGHDAGHLAVFRSTRANWRFGQVCWSLTIGIGFWYWRDRHNRHHAHTNDTQDDPEFAGSGIIAFTEEDAASRRGWRRVLARYQALLTPLLLVFMLFLALALRVESWSYTLRHLYGRRRRAEVVLLVINALAWAAPYAALGMRWLAIFAGSQFVAGLYFALIVAPNHKGMPVWAKGAQLSFLEQQVLSSRNVTAHPVWDFLYGGLNYQIEHHLFPTMPRAHYRRARDFIKPFCRAPGLDYEEQDPLASYRMVLAELRRVGGAAA
jgi:fatty acid desaturase